MCLTKFGVKSEACGDSDSLVSHSQINAVIGGARSMSPACGAVAARSLALSREPLAFYIFLI